jgi:hypothetical protein
MCQRGHIFALMFQAGRLETSLLPNVPAHVLPSFILNSGQGDLFLMNLFGFFLFPSLPPTFFAPPAVPPADAASAFAPSSSVGSLVAGGSVKEDGRWRVNVPKRTLSMKRRQLRKLSSILSRWVAVRQSSSQSWNHMSTAYMNFEQNSASVQIWALRDCCKLSTCWIMAVMAWWAMLNWLKKMLMRPWKPSNCCIISM